MLPPTPHRVEVIPVFPHKWGEPQRTRHRKSRSQSGCRRVRIPEPKMANRRIARQPNSCAVALFLTMTAIKAPGAQLDATQYQAEAIAKYEAIYGQHFISPGGADSARACIARLGLKRGMRVLDVGCGLGGSTFLMAREHGVSVHGIDVSANMLASARERLRSQGLAPLVTLEHADVLALPANPRYEVIYSRDVFLHIPDKPRLMAQVRGLLL